MLVAVAANDTIAATMKVSRLFIIDAGFRMLQIYERFVIFPNFSNKIW
jgi:hypothetical protein